MTTMIRPFLSIFILMISIACGIKNKPNESNTNTIDSSSVVSSSIKSVPSVTQQEQLCNYDNQVSSLGVGLVIAPTTFEIYHDSLLKDKMASWDMYQDASNLNVCSKFFKPDYGIMHFVCIGITHKAYKVLVNFSDIKYLPKTKNYNFETWEEYILQSYGISRMERLTGNVSTKHPLRINPNDKADTLIIPNGHELFCPIEMKGDWIKVKYDCFYQDEDNAHEDEPCHNYIDQCKDPFMGWMRWRQENQLLIDIYLMP
jgi:hypothetical protein